MEQSRALCERFLEDEKEGSTVEKPYSDEDSEKNHQDAETLSTVELFIRCVGLWPDWSTWYVSMVTSS